MPDLVPVDHDPFKQDPKLIPVDHDPFGGAQFSKGFDWANKAADIGSKMVYGAMEGLVTLPKRAIEASERNVEHFGEEGYQPEVGPAVETALNMVGGAGVVPAEANALRTGLGINSVGAHTKKLAQFERLEAKGASPETNYSMSGWYRGGDGQPRFWLSDEGSKLVTDKLERHSDKPHSDLDIVAVPNQVWESPIPGTGKTPGTRGGFRHTKLSDIWDHPKLYKAYPWLKDIKVRGADQRGGGFYSYGQRTINLGEATKRNLQDTIHHEVVHAIQHYEGFAPGGSSKQFLPEDFHKTKSLIEQAEASLDERIKQETGWNPLSAMMVADMKPAEMNAEQAAVFDKMRESGLLDQIKRYRETARAILDREAAADRRYLQLHGELEARDAPYIRKRGGAEPGKIPLHVNPELDPAHQIEVTRSYGKYAPKMVPVDHDPFAGER